MKIFYKEKGNVILELKCDKCQKGMRAEPLKGFHYIVMSEMECREQAENDGWVMYGIDICCSCRVLGHGI